MKKKVIVPIALIFGVMQFIPLNRDIEPVEKEHDLIVKTQPTEDIKKILKTACYDCHSNETIYPWYTRVAPFSFWMQHHVNEGKEHLNFSKWGTFSEKKRLHKIDECVELVEEKEMPLSSYTWFYHEEANLTDEQRDNLIKWFNSIR